MPTKKRKTYSKEFKAKAVAAVKTSSVAAVAKSIGVTPKSVASWVKAAKAQKTTTLMKAYGGNAKKKAKPPSSTDKIARLEKSLAKSQADLATAKLRYEDCRSQNFVLQNNFDTLFTTIGILSNPN